MIFGNLNNMSFIEEKLKKIIIDIVNRNIEEIDNGTYIVSDDIFFNKVCLQARGLNETFWEGHKKYIDIHIILNGKEQINYNQRKNLEYIEYLAKDDFCSYKGNRAFPIILEKDDFVIFYPDDIHMTGVKSDLSSESVNKVIIKVKC